MLYTGVDLFTLSKVIEDSRERYEAETPTVFPVASVSLPEEGGFSYVVKDGLIRNAYAIGSDPTITIETGAISPNYLNEVLNGSEEPAFFDNGISETNYYAMGFRLLMADGSYNYYSYPKGTITVDSKTIQTKQGTTAVVENITFKPLVTNHVFDLTGKPSRKILVNTNRYAVNSAGWLAMVWTPDNFLPVPAPVVEITALAETENTATVAMYSLRSADTVHYTTDGTTPTADSPVYTEPITVAGGTVVKAVECATCKTLSGITSIEIPLYSMYAISYGGYAIGYDSYVIGNNGRSVTEEIPTYEQLTPPTISVAGDTDLTITITPAEGAVAYYTLDDSYPSNGSNLYSGALTITPPVRLKAISYSGNAIPSEVASYSNSKPLNWSNLGNFSNSSIKHLVSNGEILVYGTYAGKLARSVDGINWSEEVAPFGTLATTRVDAVAYGNGLFVAISDNDSAYSEDGINWTKGGYLSSADSYLLAYGNGLFVARAYESTDGITISSYFTSSDGKTWSRAYPTGISGNGYLSSLCFGNGSFIAGTSTGAMLYSEDGISWANGVSPFADLVKSTYYENGLFIAGTSTGAMAYSEDGINWVEIESPFADSINSICFGNGYYIAVGNGGAMAYSVDGISWIAIDTGIAWDYASVGYIKETFTVGSNHGYLAYCGF